MNIGIDARYLETEMTGIGRYSYNLLVHLLKVDRHNHYHVLLRDTYTGDLPNAPNVTYHYVRHLPISLGTLVPWQYRKLFEQLDLFHAHFPVTPLFPHPRCVVTVHDLQPLLEPRLGTQRPAYARIAYRIYYPLFYRTTLYRAQAIIAVSLATRWYLETYLGIPRERIHVVHEAIDERFGRPRPQQEFAVLAQRYGIPESFLLYVGATLPHKNLASVLRGYARVVQSDEMNGLALVIAGRSSRFNQELKNTIRKLGVEHFVHMIGYVSSDDLPTLYAMARALLYVTRFEGFGFPPLEALACGTPVVLSAHAALPEVVGPCALFVDPEDIGGIAKAIRTIATNSELRNRIVSMARIRLKRYLWEQAAIQTLRIYQEVGADKRSTIPRPDLDHGCAGTPWRHAS